MRYATWEFFLDSAGQKTTPELVQGITFIDENQSKILGYIDASADISQMDKWAVTEMTQIEAFNLISAKIKNVTIDSNGMFIFPKEDLTPKENS